ncbi:MAG: glycosyltransferase family 2 protein [Sulfurifustaceae bacterium]
MEPKTAVTVAIATFNRANVLPRAIASVLRQTVQSFEIIVVDDGSTPSTEPVVRGIGDPRIRYIRHERNQGLPAARNTAIRAAAGEYIAFLDDDDEWLEDKLEKQRRALARCDAVLTAAYVNDRSRVKRFKRATVTVDDLRKGNAFDPSTLMVKTAVMRELLFDASLRVGEDWDAFIRIARKYRVHYLREPLIVYSEQLPLRMTAEATALTLPQLEQRMSILHKHRKFFGPFWFNYHTAAFLLSHLGARADKSARIRYAIQRCGVVPVMRLLLGKAMKHGLAGPS